MKQKKPLIDWELDAGFYSVCVKVKARTKGEARKKAMAKLQKMPMSKIINKHTTYLSKSF